MEFKTILYVLAVIAWVVFNNYKKIVAENKKRSIKQPPVTTAERTMYQPTVAKEAKPVPVIISNPKTFKTKPVKSFTSSTPVKEIGKPDNKTLYESLRRKNKAQREMTNTYERLAESKRNLPIQRAVTAIAPVISIPRPQSKKNKLTFNINNKSELKMAFVLGEILNKPLF